MNDMERRLAQRQDELDWLFMELYNDRVRLDELKTKMARSYQDRSQSLRRLDRKREADPKWFRTGGMLLASNPGVTFRKKQIYASIWHEERDVGVTVVTNHMSALRKKLGLPLSNKEYIETIHKVGYRFVKYK